MTTEEYSKHLGKLVANFQSLEFILRAFLQELPAAPPMGVPYGTDIYSFPVGTTLPVNHLTSYDSLRKLIRKFNTEVGGRHLAQIDETLADVRDALAHGRVSAASPDANLRLLKYDRPNHGMTRVNFNQVLTMEWFATQIRLVHDTILEINKRMPG